MTRLAVGISGEVAAGKTTAGKTLRQFSFGYTRISKVIDKILAERGEQPSRERHQELGWQLHVEKGQAWLCEQAIQLLGPEPSALVLDGMRWTDDVTYMRERFGAAFLHLHISAPEQIRKIRFEGDDKKIPYEEVVSHNVEQGVQELAALADLALVNDGSKESFQIEVLGRILEKQINAR